jgi:enoyl-CoA hydratase/carnithine racemase
MNAQDPNHWPVPLPDCVQLRREGTIVVLTLNRAHKRNALSDDLVLGLQTFFSSIPADVQGVVMHGEGDNFCAGLDLNELKETSVAESFHTSQIGQRLNDTVQFCRVPVVAVLRGAVIGGGLELAAAAHVRVAEPSAYYALPEGTRGIFLGSGGSVRLPRLIGASTVIEMMLTGRVYEAEEAHQRLRFSHYLVEPGEGLAKGLALAQRMAKNAPLANFAMIQAIPRIVEQDPNAGLFTEMLMVGIAQGDEEAKSRLRDFLERKANKVTRGAGA